jgi:hypothetical protein
MIRLSRAAIPFQKPTIPNRLGKSGKPNVAAVRRHRYDTAIVGAARLGNAVTRTASSLSCSSAKPSLTGITLFGKVIDGMAMSAPWPVYPATVNGHRKEW